MDRPKQRWLIILGLALTCGLILLARQMMLTTDADRVPARAAPMHSVERQSAQTESAETDAPFVATPATDTTSSAPPPPVERGIFRGRVIDAVTRKPVEEFEIRLRRWQRVQPGSSEYGEQRVVQKFRSDAGRFAWRDAPAGTWKVTVAAADYQYFELEELRIVAHEATSELVMPLLRGYTLKGRIFDQRSGAGIGTAWLSFREEAAQPGVGQRMEPSQEDGSFVLEGVPGGRLAVTAGASGHATRELQVLVNDATPNLEIGLSTGGTISGFLVTATGAPISGGKVFLGNDANQIALADETNPAGEFSFKHLAAARYRIMASAAAGTASQELTLAPDERRDGIVLNVGEGRSIRGVVRGLRPEQLPQSFISLRSDAKTGSFSAQPDDQGNYALHGVPPGRAHLTASAGLYRQLYKTLDVPADKDVTLNIEFPAGTRLSGRVTQNGKPMPGTSIWVRPVERPDDILYSARSAENGSYEIDGLAAGEYEIAADQAPAGRIRIADESVFNIEVPSTQLGGRVLEAGGAVPIIGAGVHVMGLEKATSRVRVYKESDHFGQFALTGVEPGEIILSVYKPGYEMYRERIAFSSPITDMTIRLSRSNGVEIRAHLASGEPVREVMLQATGIGLYIHLDENGVGSVPIALAGGTLSIRGPRKDPIVIRDWNAQPLDLQF
jgi:hypothetical protein